MGIAELIQLPHFPVMLSAIILLTLALIFIIIHKPKKWFSLHVIFASAGIILAVIGLFILDALLLFLTHAFIGLIVFIILVGTILIGTVAYRMKRKKVRNLHIWISRIIYVISIVAVVLGISFFLI
ncbi:MAG: hypothetical protein ACFFE4_08595 [Candidatus Thorarchaeota archaeon]